MINKLYENCIKDRWGLGFIPFVGIMMYGASLSGHRDDEERLKEEIVLAEKDMEAILDERGLGGYNVQIFGESQPNPQSYLIAGGGLGGMIAYSFVIPGFLRKRGKEES